MDLKNWIKKNNIDITRFALKVGATEATIYRIMRGKTPRLDLACRIHKETGNQVSHESMIEKKSKKKLLNKE